MSDLKHCPDRLLPPFVYLELHPLGIGFDTQLCSPLYRL